MEYADQKRDFDEELPERFDLDLEVLEQNYLERIRSAHPDQQQGDFQISSDLNRAYQTLLDPLLRAQHLLVLRGGEATETIQDMAVLQRSLEDREKLASAETLEALESLVQEAKRRVQETEGILAAIFGKKQKDLIELAQQKTKASDNEDTFAVGIDLGTTNSLVAFCQDSDPKILLDHEGRSFEPSVVSYSSETGSRVGHEADQDPKALHSIKRLMGMNFASLPRNYGFESHIATPLDENDHSVRLNVGVERTVTPAEVSSEILKSLKKRAEEDLGCPVKRAVITVPAYFDEAARVATREAATLAGLDVLRLINEPTAAAYAYGLNTGAEGVYAFYDLGGGTFDFTLLRLHQGIFQVLATGGDTALGGDDIDKAFLKEVMEKQKLGATSIREIRALKEDLSQAERVIFKDGFLNRHQLEVCARPFVEKTLEVCRRVFRDAKVSPKDIKGVVLVGGATRMPLIRRAVTAFFGKSPLVDCDPDQIVALGAALQAKALTQGK
ncbi:uncharacterized protein LOC111320276, partial [Stylophora pistillata]|uniref:uncharacterized protein LOC111320276 n=1 Tax=Stylophora pistillata TaxID=50429 RepID=UPI000C044A7A